MNDPAAMTLNQRIARNPQKSSLNVRCREDGLSGGRAFIFASSSVSR